MATNQDHGRISVVIDNQAYLIFLKHRKFKNVAELIHHVEEVVELPMGYIKSLTLRNMVIPSSQDVRVIFFEDELTAITKSYHGTSKKHAAPSCLKREDLTDQTADRHPSKANGYRKLDVEETFLSPMNSYLTKRIHKSKTADSGQGDIQNPVLPSSINIDGQNQNSESPSNEKAALDKRKMELLRFLDQKEAAVTALDQNNDQSIKRKRRRVRTHRKRKSHTGPQLELPPCVSEMYDHSPESLNNSVLESFNQCSGHEDKKPEGLCTIPSSVCAKMGQQNEQWAESLRHLSTVKEEDSKVYSIYISSPRADVSMDEDYAPDS